MLPEETSLHPIGELVDAKLDGILKPPTLDRSLLEAVRPEIQNRSIFHLAQYPRLRLQILEKLTALAAEATEGSERQMFGQACELLRKQDLFHSSGEENRYALLQG